MAVVTSSLVSALRVGFQREFQDALSSAPSQWDRLSTRVPSSSAGNTYGWIGQFPKLREWSGDRSFKNIKEHGYSVMNNLYEATVDIPRTAVEDDDIGVYAPLFREMGYAAGLHRQVLFTIGLVLFVFIMIINVCLTRILKAGDPEVKEKKKAARQEKLAGKKEAERKEAVTL